MYAVPYLSVPEPAATRPGGAAGLAMALAARPDWWRPLVNYRTGTRWFRLIEQTGEREVWLLSWLPGQGTELHDHGPSSGAFAVADGALTERMVGVKPGRPPLDVTRLLTAGRSRAFGPHYIHQVTNTGDVPAVSVHVYAPGLTVMNTYEVAPGGLHHRTAEQAGVDW